MFTKIKIVLAATLLVASGTLALAFNFDPNPANRYPAYNGPVGTAPADYNAVHTGNSVQSAPVKLRSAPVRLQSGRNAAEFGSEQNDRASSPYAGGVG